MTHASADDALKARAGRAAAVAKRRAEEKADAYDFLVHGERHVRCLHALGGGAPCSRDYDPRPYPEAMPSEPRLYARTGIGALYGLPDCAGHLWQIAGWNLKPRSTQ